jgi:hypothetical protein
MKITAEHFATLTAKVAPFDTPERREQYKAQGLTDKRYRWDLSYLGGKGSDPESTTRFICDVLYEYLNDTHIDTALRTIVKPL